MKAGRTCHLCKKSGFQRRLTMKNVRIQNTRKYVCLECFKKDFKKCGSIKRSGKPCETNVHKDEDWCQTHQQIEHKRKYPHLYCKKCFENPYKTSGLCLHHIEQRIETHYKNKLEVVTKKKKKQGNLTKQKEEELKQKYFWGIDDKHMPKVIQKMIQRCIYCNKRDGIGELDRINNTKNYTLDNITPACHHCNIAKGQLTQQQFFEMCVNVTEKLREKCEHTELQGEKGREIKVIL